MGIYLGVPPDSVIDYSDKLVNGKKLNETVSACYTVCESKGATISTEQTADNLSSTIQTIVTPLYNVSKDCIVNDPQNKFNVRSIAANGFSYGDMIVQIVNLPVVESIGDSAFSGSYVESLTAPKLSSIGVCAFQQCNLISVSLPALKVIGEYAFLYNGGLETLSAPLLTSIGADAFYESHGLRHLYFSSMTVNQVSANTSNWSIYPYQGDCVIHCSDGDVTVKQVD